MSCELPAVVSDLGANREWVQHGVNGYICEIGNVHSIANNIKSLLRNPEWGVKFGKLSRQIIVREADLSSNMQKAERYYRELTSSAK